MILNARSRAFIEDDHAASLDGTGGTDTHYAELEGMDGRTAGLEGTQGPDPMLVGESGLTAMLQGTESADTRMAVLAGGVTDDHAAALEGDAIIGLTGGITASTGTDAAAGIMMRSYLFTIPTGTWTLVGSYLVSDAPPAGSGVMLEASHQMYFVQNRVPLEYRVVGLFNNKVVGSGSLEVDSDEVIYPAIIRAYDPAPPAGVIGYNMQVRATEGTAGNPTIIRAGLYTYNYTVVNPGTDTHAAMLQGEASVGDTHESVLEGLTAAAVAPRLIGAPGTDTHVAVLQGSPPAPSLGASGIFTFDPNTPRMTGPLTTLALPSSTSASVQVSNSAAGVRGMIAVNIYEAGAGRTYSWTVTRGDGTVVRTGTSSGPAEGVLVADTFQDAAPGTGTITYTLAVQGTGGATRICSAAISAATPSVTDDHAAVLEGDGAVDGHTAAIEGEITEDTHTAMLEGEDTHSVIFDGDADTHAAVFEGEDTVKAALRGGEGDDTHQAVLSGSSRTIRRSDGNGVMVVGGYDE